MTTPTQAQHLSPGQGTLRPPSPISSQIPQIDLQLGSDGDLGLSQSDLTSDEVATTPAPAAATAEVPGPEHEGNIPLTDMGATTADAAGGTVEAGSKTMEPQITSATPKTETEAQQQQEPYIGPAKDGVTDDGGPGGEPAIYTTLCIANTENRHRWKITADYLRRRGETVPPAAEPASTPAPPGNELLDITVATVKRLLLADWRSEWEGKPSDISGIRLISMGELLADDKTLRSFRFKINGETRPILVSVRRPPEDDQDGEPDAPNKTHGASGEDGQPRQRMCGCCLIM